LTIDIGQSGSDVDVSITAAIDTVAGSDNGGALTIWYA
jgi:hypothetical protein